MSRSAKQCLVVVPMKDPVLSKSRLATALNSRQRQQLAVLLYKRTLGVLLGVASARGDTEVAVVTNSKHASDIACQLGITVIPEGEAGSLSKAVDTAAEWAVDLGFSSLCVIPADLAAPDEADLMRFVSVGVQQGQPIICPSTDLGTNAIFVAPPNIIKFQYGKQSSTRHRKCLEKIGKAPILLPLESLRFDIDTQECLERAAFHNRELQDVIGATS